jgi:hypothetical protein
MLRYHVSLAIILSLLFVPLAGAQDLRLDPRDAWTGEYAGTTNWGYNDKTFHGRRTTLTITKDFGRRVRVVFWGYQPSTGYLQLTINLPPTGEVAKLVVTPERITLEPSTRYPFKIELERDGDGVRGGIVEYQLDTDGNPKEEFWARNLSVTRQ